ncbi:MAG: hypothetical protein Kow00109_01160 [Acidobacteriota bacterium]
MEDERLKEYRRQLEEAINDALMESAEVSEAIRQIRESGYDVFLIIEATVGFSRRAENLPELHSQSQVKLELTPQDERFLRALKISPR